jgi:hypothetical protein
MADQIKATPRSPILGLFSDIVNLPLQYMSAPERTQQSQGVAQFLYGTGIPKTLERMSYGDSLFSGAGGLGGTTRMRPETADALMNVAPFAPSAGKVGKTVGRMAGAEINAAMTGQPTRSLLGAITPKPKLLDVYHGTPHTLPPTPRNPLGEFDASKIGTGEGAQAYGYGIYTAEVPTIAKEYRRKLGGVDIKLGDTSLDEIIAKGGADAKAAQRLKSDFTNPSIAQNPDDVSNPSFWKETENFYQTIDSPENSGVKKLLDKFGAISASTKGNLYKIDLPDEKIATMLDWDKPVSQQKNVIDALRKEAEQRVKDKLLVNIENDIRSQLPMQDIGNDYMALFGNQNIAVNQDIRQQALDKLNKLDLKPLVEQELDSFKTPDMTWDMSGGDLYQLLSQRSGSPQQASNLLQSQGIAGIRYLDEGSRATTGKQTYNFVVFPNEEKSMTILERNGVRAFPQEATYPQQAALDLAQQRAALPVEQGGLGLLANNTAADRAKAMGFDTDLLHGTARDFPAFDLSKAGTNTRQAGDELGIFSTSKPFLANDYAQIASRGGWANRTTPENAVVYPLVGNFQNPKKYETASQFYRDADAMAAEQNLGNWRKKLQGQGYDSVFVRPDLEEVVAFSPDQLRSRFAAFDPFRKDVATATAMGVALPDLLAQPVNQVQPIYETTPMYTDPFGNTIGSSIR